MASPFCRLHNGLAHAHPLHELAPKLKVHRRLKHQHNRRAKVEEAHLLPLRHVDAAKVLPFTILATPRIGRQILVKVHDNAAHVGGPHRGQREEPVLPAAEEGHPLVGVKQAGHFLDDAGRHAVELAGEVAPLVDGPGGGRVKAVVV